jgi:hypothetical protein
MLDFSGKLFRTIFDRSTRLTDKPTWDLVKRGTEWPLDDRVSTIQRFIRDIIMDNYLQPSTFTKQELENAYKKIDV